jgi:hypothetical protein
MANIRTLDTVGLTSHKPTYQDRSFRRAAILRVADNSTRTSTFRQTDSPGTRRPHNSRAIQAAGPFAVLHSATFARALVGCARTIQINPGKVRATRPKRATAAALDFHVWHAILCDAEHKPEMPERYVADDPDEGWTN